MEPMRRVSARVLPVAPDGRVLLLQAQDPARPGDLHWISVGGGVDEGESRADAAVREMLEETGIVIAEAELVGPVHEGDYPFSFAGVDYVAVSTFYGCALPATAEVSFAGLDEAEVGNVLAARWWTPEDLRADGTAAEADLPDVMTAAIAAVRGAK